METDTLEKDTFLGKLNETKISFFFYQYPLLFPSLPFSGTSIKEEMPKMIWKDNWKEIKNSIKTNVKLFLKRQLQ